jgi:aminodeoxyfutalosine deaminase
VSLASYLAAAPKAELHVHFQGSILPQTLLALARRNRIELPSDTEEGLRRWFEQARTAGLPSAPHAGETVGPASVWGALRALGAERIGHGVRSIEDPALVRYLAETGVPLELNPTSNVRLGVYLSLADHPLRRLHEAGVTITVSSDDPPLFNTTVTEEIQLLATAFGYDVAAIDEILLNSVRHAFLPEPSRRALEAEFRAELTALKTVHLIEE